MASKTPTTEAPEKPAYEATYELSTLMTSEIVSLLDPTGARNPAYIALAVVLAVLVFYGFTAHPGSWDPFMLIGGAVAIGLLFVATRWRGVQEKRVRRQGLDAHDLREDGRRWTVDVWDGRLEVTRPDGEMVTYPFSDIKRVSSSPSMILVVMKEGALVAIPRKALSESRFEGCRLLLEKASAK